MGEPKPQQVRQGDVLITPISPAEVPETAEPVGLEAGKVVLAHGEVTGHSHAIQDEAARLVALQGEAARRFLQVEAQQVTLRHEEHGPIQITKGAYEVTIQREYDEGTVRNVAD